MSETYDYEAKRVYKPLAQTMLWNAVKKPVRRGLLFPAKYCLDMKAGIERGLINSESTLLLFECEADVMRHIRIFCEEHGLTNAVFFQMKFEDILKRKHHRPGVVTDMAGNDLWVDSKKSDVLDVIIGDILDCENLDVFFPDFCGSLTQERNDAIEAILCNCGSQTTVSGFTFEVGLRNNSLKKKDGETNAPSAIKIPGDAQVFYDSPLTKSAIWTARNLIPSLKRKRAGTWFFDKFVMYKEKVKGAPMLFLLHDANRQAEDNKKQKENSNRYHTSDSPHTRDREEIRILLAAIKGKSGGKLSAVTRKINALRKRLLQAKKTAKGAQQAHYTMTLKLLGQ